MSTRRPSKPISASEKHAKRCRQVVDACLFVCLFLTPLWFGGRHDLGRWLYAATVAVAAVAWVARKALLREPAVRTTKAHALLLAAVALVALQLAPMPAAVIERLSPGLTDLAPAWGATGESPLQLGELRSLSANPGATRIGLAVLVSHALLFCVVVERLRDERDIRRLLLAIGAASTAMAAFGLVQWLTSNGKLMWLYTHPQREIGDQVQGAFANKNHFAHFVILGIGPLLLAVHGARQKHSKRSKSKRPSHATGNPKLLVLGSIGAAVAFAAVMFSLSRGGLMALAAAVGSGALLLLLRGGIRPRDGWVVAGVTAVAILALSFGDLNALANRYDDLTSGSLEELDHHRGRREIWAANVRAFWANPWVGYGVGSHAHVYPAFIAKGFATEFTHAESGYLQTTTETGLAGGALMLAAWALVATWCVRGVAACNDRRRLLMWAAVIVGLVASVVHSFVDFVWYIPACMTVTVLLAACALRLHQVTDGGQQARHEEDRAKPSTPLAWAPIGATALAAVWATATLWGPGAASLAWDRYVRASVQERTLVASALRRPNSKKTDRADDIAFLKKQMIESLEQVVRRNPSDARAWLRLAGRRLQWFETLQEGSPNKMPLLPLRDAALASRFATLGETKAWLERAWGENASLLIDAYRDTRTALRLAPLHGDGYVLLSKLTYLAPPPQRDLDALMAQALILRPHDGGVLFEAGRHALVAGDLERSVELWRRAHAIPGAGRLHIVATCAAHYPAQIYLNEFKPDWLTLSAVHQQYRRRENADDLGAIGRYAVAIAEQPADSPLETTRSLRTWCLASRIASDLEDYGEAAHRAEQAVGLAPNNFNARRALAMAYVQSDRLDDAAPHLRWCLSRRPHDRAVQDWLRKHQVQRQLASRQPAERIER